MKILRICTIIFILLQSLFGSSQGFNIPDSVIRVLEKKQFEEQLSILNDFGTSYSLNGDYEIALQYFFKALELEGNKLTSPVISDIKNNIGNVYAETGNYHVSTKYYLEALSLSSINSEKEVSASAMASIGLNYYELGDFNQAAMYFQRAREKYGGQAFSDSVGMVYLCVYISEILIERNELKACKDTLSFALNIIPKGDCIHYLKGMVLTKIGKMNTVLKQFDVALKSFKEADSLLSICSNHTDQVHTLLGIGDLYYIQNKADSSIKYAYLALQKAEDGKYSYGKKEAYELILDGYRKKRDFEKYFIIRDSLIAIDEKVYSFNEINSLNEIINEQETKEREAIYNDKLDLIARNRALTRYRYGILAMAFAFLLAGGVLGILYLKTKRKTLELIKKSILLSKKSMEDDIKSKNDEIYAFSQYIAEKNKFLENVRTTLKKLNQTHSKVDVSPVINRVTQNLSEERKSFENENYSMQIDNHFFYKLNLKYPKLTEKERRLCSLLSLKLTTKEIAEILNIEDKSVEKSRNRLRKKIGIPSEYSLTQFFEEL